VDIKIPEAVDVQILADVFHGHLVGDQLVRVREIDAIVAGKAVRRTTDAHMHFGRAGLAQINHARPGGGSTNDGIVHHHHSLAGDHFLDQVELYAHVEIANQLARLEECAANVMVPNECVRVGNVQ